jgi:hypothetical protein
MCKEPRPSGRALLLVLHIEETGSNSLAAAFVTIRAILDFPTVSSPLIQIQVLCGLKHDPTGVSL